MAPHVTLIAALAANRVIGRAGKVPWSLPEDLHRFKALTLNHTVIMGRKTWEADLERRPLPQRHNVVVSRSLPASPPPDHAARPALEIVPTIAAALASVPPDHTAFIIGGASLYSQTLPLADRLELTLLDYPVLGDTWFPEYQSWLEHNVERVYYEPRSGFSFVTYQRQ